jgi:hypothetical protein
MTAMEMGYLALIVGALTLFGGALAWASWTESRNTSRAGEKNRS